MTERTEAQRLAGELEDESKSDPDDYRWKSAAELLRLDAENAALRDALGQIHTALVIDGFVQPHHLKAASAALSGTAPAADVRQAVEAEREACAKVCEQSDRYRGDYFASIIRARSQA